MLISSFVVLISSVGEYTADIEVVINRLEDVIILYKLRNRGYSKNCCVLSVSRFCLVVLDDMVGYERHPFVCHVKLSNIDSFGHGSVILIVVALNRLDILNVESENIVVKDRILDKI